MYINVGDLGLGLELGLGLGLGLGEVLLKKLKSWDLASLVKYLVPYEWLINFSGRVF